MNVSFLYFDGCPNWQLALQRTREALQKAGEDATSSYLQQVTTPQQAAQLAFRGSPTILIDGVDPFADHTAPVGLACRLYPGSAGLSGSPSTDDLAAAFRAAR